MDTKLALDAAVSASLNFLIQQQQQEPFNVDEKTAKEMIFDALSTWTAQDVITVWEQLIKVQFETDFIYIVLGLMSSLIYKLPSNEHDIFFELLKKNWNQYGPAETKSTYIEVLSQFLEDVDTYSTDNAVLVSKMVDFSWNLSVESGEEADFWTGLMGLHCLLDMEQYAPGGDQLPRSLLEHWVKRHFEEIRKDVCPVRMLERLKRVFNIYHRAQKMEEKAAAKWAAGHIQDPRKHPSNVRASILGTKENRWRSFLILEHDVIRMIAESLVVYVDRARQAVQGSPDASNLQRDSFKLFGNDTHDRHVSYRLKFIRIFLKSFAYTLELPVAMLIWNCLVVNPVFEGDRDAASKWFYELSKANLMDPIDEDFFSATFRLLNPALLTDSGADCMIQFSESAFASRLKELGSPAKRDSDDSTLLIPELDYSWKVFLSGKSSVSEKVLKWLKELMLDSAKRVPMNKKELLRTKILDDIFDKMLTSYDIFRTAILNPGARLRRVCHEESKRLARIAGLVFEFGEHA